MISRGDLLHFVIPKKSFYHFVKGHSRQYKRVKRWVSKQDFKVATESHFINLSSTLCFKAQSTRLLIPALLCSLCRQQLLFTMTSLSVSTNFTLYPNATFLRFQYPNRPQRITFPKTTQIWCSAAGQPRRQQRQPKKKKTVTDGEKGVDPVGFLTKFGISHKQFAQFLRERYIKLTHSQSIDHKTC